MFSLTNCFDSTNHATNSPFLDKTLISHKTLDSHAYMGGGLGVCFTLPSVTPQKTYLSQGVAGEAQS